MKNLLMLVAGLASFQAFGVCKQEGAPWSTVGNYCYNSNQQLYWSDDTGIPTINSPKTWEQAKTYCQSFGFRLPTAAEMQAARVAHGEDFLTFGYGAYNYRWTADNNGKKGKSFSATASQIGYDGGEAVVPGTSGLFTFCVSN